MSILQFENNEWCNDESWQDHAPFDEAHDASVSQNLCNSIFLVIELIKFNESMPFSLLSMITALFRFFLYISYPIKCSIMLLLLLLYSIDSRNVLCRSTERRRAVFILLISVKYTRTNNKVGSEQKHRRLGKAKVCTPHVRAISNVRTTTVNTV